MSPMPKAPPHSIGRRPGKDFYTLFKANILRLRLRYNIRLWKCLQFLIWAICNFGGPVSLSIVFQSGMQKLTIGIEKLANWKLLKVKSMDGPALLICLLSRLWDRYYRRSPQKSQIIQRAIILKPSWWSWWLWWKAAAWSCFWPAA